MQPDRQALLRYGAKPVAVVLLVLLAVLAGFSAVLHAPSAAAETGVTTESDTTTPADAPSVTETPTDMPTDEPSDEATDDATGEPTDDTPGEPTGEPTEEPSESMSPVPADGVEVDDAVFRWGINNQSNARSHNPGAYNFFSAGIANPGRGGVHLLEKHWSAKAGNVVIQKWMGNRRGWKRSVWQDWRTAADGSRTGMDSNFSLHNVVINGGTGTVDRVTRTAEIRWKGTFTVVYYSGNAIFTVTDPVLRVTDGVGEVTAVLGGWASERDQMSQWEPVASVRATIATLPKVKFGKDGVTSMPAYEGLNARGFSDQVTNGVWGAFPQSMLDFLGPLDIAQFWYSTGLSTDHTKVPLPITVSYDGANAPEPTPTDEPSAVPTVTNPTTAPPPPPPVPDPAPVVPPIEVAPILPVAPGVALPAAQRPLLTASDLSAAVPVSAPVAAAAVDSDRTWWAVGGLLLLAALLLSVPSRPRRT